MPALFVLMGSGRTRKSAAIRALTGFTRNGNGEIRPLDVKLTDDTIIKICVFSASPQEVRTRVPEFAGKIVNIDREWNIFLALHPDKEAVEYIRAITRTNGYEIFIAPLGMEEIPNHIRREFREQQLNPRIISPGIANSGNIPANEIAARIRREWGWL